MACSCCVQSCEGYWDYTIFVDAAFAVTLGRARQRDLALFGNVSDVTQRYEQRYIPGQQLYLEACCPKQRADLVIENNDPGQPVLVKGRPTCPQRPLTKHCT